METASGKKEDLSSMRLNDLRVLAHSSPDSVVARDAQIQLDEKLRHAPLEYLDPTRYDNSF